METQVRGGAGRTVGDGEACWAEEQPALSTRQVSGASEDLRVTAGAEGTQPKTGPQAQRQHTADTRAPGFPPSFRKDSLCRATSQRLGVHQRGPAAGRTRAAPRTPGKVARKPHLGPKCPLWPQMKPIRFQGTQARSSLCLLLCC